MVYTEVPKNHKNDAGDRQPNVASFELWTQKACAFSMKRLPIPCMNMLWHSDLCAYKGPKKEHMIQCFSRYH